MVDQSIYIQGITDSGRVVTFTAREAMKYGFCDGMAESVEEVLKKEQVENYTIRSYHPTVTDRIIGFLINPVIQGLLIMVIVGGIYFELQTPGIGFPLAAALTACLLYFAPLYLEGFAGYWEIIAFVVGVVLLLLEIFVIPGFGVAGISGIVLIIVALVFAGIDHFSFRFLKYLCLPERRLVIGYIYKKEDCDCRYCLYCRRRKCRAVRCCCLEDKIRTRSPVLNENDKEIYEFYTKGKNEHESNHHKKRSDRRP